MYKINTITRIRNIAILLSLSVGLMLIASNDVSAQYGNNGYSRDNRGYYSNNSTNIAQRYGYQDGFKDGADAAREGDRFHPQNSGDWQKGTNGYESRYGNKSTYKQAYRNAYISGYEAGYQRSDGRRNDRNRDNRWRRNY